jgi:hypothetical protein
VSCPLLSMSSILRNNSGVGVCVLMADVP